jgi:hypothetical protein
VNNYSFYDMMTTKNRKKTKTDTIVQRTINVYLPTFEMKEKWKEIAENSNQSISKFIIEHVTNSLNHEKESPSIETRIKLIKDKKQLQNENTELLKQNKLLENLCERQEKEIRTHTVQPFLQEDFTGIREYSENLVRLFKTCKEVRKEDIYDRLKINPRDKDATTAVQKQIDNLERYGLLKDIGGKWRWKG